MLAPGTTAGGRYRIVSVLGRGGMGTVYAAEPLAGGAAVALKTLNPEFSDSPEVRARFEREARATGFLSHPHVVSVSELGALDDGTLYLAMELVQGSDVGELLDRGPLHPRRALVLLRQTLLGLGYAHQHGLVHRDLKPDNLMVTRAGEAGREHDHVKILDFGIVKILSDVASAFGEEALTRTGAVFGTPKYMAPEQALGRRVDHRADLYSAGIVLYEMLTGAPPFHSADSLQLLRMHAAKPPPPLDPHAAYATPAMVELIDTALAKKPEQRFATAKVMTKAIGAAFASIEHIPNSP